LPIAIEREIIEAAAGHVVSSDIAAAGIPD